MPSSMKLDHDTAGAGECDPPTGPPNVPSAPPLHPPPPPPPPVKTRVLSSPKPVPLPPPMSTGSFPIPDEVHHPQSLQKMKDNIRQDSPFSPCHMFFYGSLMDPEVIQAVLQLSDRPVTKKAALSGFSTKMWGIYPALIPDSKGLVGGVVWEVSSEAHFRRLEAYETSAYAWTRCSAQLDDGTSISECRTFFWAGDPESKELEEGSFDLERYQKYFKRSVTRERPTDGGFCN
ncbi:hypothetical protein J1614_006407 [Plenodomus biglobosus]|nr:hypothetical protein J1614_006407 [Plenodomus biglobosus]